MSRRLSFAFALCGFPCVALCAQSAKPAADTPIQSAAVVAPSSDAVRKAQDAYIEGARALDRNHLDQAERAFLEAIKFNPMRSDYVMALAVTREHHLTALVQQAAEARRQGNIALADNDLIEARKLDPSNPIVAQHFEGAPKDYLLHIDRTDLAAAEAADVPISPALKPLQDLGGIIHIKADSVRQSFHLRAPASQLITQVTRAYGVRVILDPSVVSTSLRLDVDDVPYAQAMQALHAVAGTFDIPIDEKTILVARDSNENREKFLHQFEETIYLSGLNNEQMNEIGNIVKQAFDIRQASVQTLSGNLIVRASEAKLQALNAILADILDGTSEVTFDIKLYEFDTSRTGKVGVVLPSQLSAYNLASQAQSLVSANQSLISQLIAAGTIPANASTAQLALYLIAAGLGSSSLISNSFLKIGGGVTTTVLSAGITPTLDFALNSSDVRTLDNVQLRVKDRETASFTNGVRYPIVTSTFSNIASSVPSGLNVNGVNVSQLLSQYLGTNGSASTNIPQVQYQDLGITLKATPTVQKTGDVHVKLDFKIQTLTGASVNDIPVLANRQLTSDVTLRDGETTMIMSMLSKQEAGAVSGVPGLSELPGFGNATDKMTQTDKTELIVMLTPHVVRRRHSNTVGPYVPLLVGADAN